MLGDGPFEGLPWSWLAVTANRFGFLAGILVDATWMLLPFFGRRQRLMTYALNKQ